MWESINGAPRGTNISYMKVLDYIGSLFNRDRVIPQEQDTYFNYVEYVNGVPVGNIQQKANLTTYWTNAHIATCVSVLADAVSQLHADIVRSTTSNGTQVFIDDNAHPANLILKGPNPDLTYADFMHSTVISLLLAGNCYILIDKTSTTAIELFLLDPSKIRPQISKDGKKIVYYEYGDSFNPIRYNRDQIIHLREFDLANPLIGKSRLESLRQELLMDGYVKTFNANFFKNGAVIGQWFTPEHRLSDDQHKQLSRAVQQMTSGIGNVFKFLISKVPGKLESPDIKHKDIAFLELLKYIRETINALFKVPPYKAGILEYANYANSTQQQETFWLDGVFPILRKIEDIINKDFIWKYFDTNHEFKFNTDDIKALKGDPKQQMEILTAYKRENIMTVDEVREKLEMEPLGEQANTTSGTEDTFTRAYTQILDTQLKSIYGKLDEISVKGNFMSRLSLYNTADIFDITKESKYVYDTISPLIRDTIQSIGDIAFTAVNNPDTFDINCDSVSASMRALQMKHDIITLKIFNILDTIFKEWKTRNYLLPELKDRIQDKLNWTFAQQIAKEIVPNIISRSTSIAESQSIITEVERSIHK